MMLGKMSLHRVNLLSLLSFFAITGITFFKAALELEDAEQAYYSQWLRWGYDDQPPLYTWLQYGVNQVFGSHKVSFSMFRGLIFASILFLLWQFARKMIKDGKKAELAIMGLVLVPVFIDFTFRRLSHTSLLCASIIASYLIVQRLIYQKTWGNYVLFGLVVGFGAMSKYNYVFFMAALGLTLFFDASIRRIIFNKKMVVTLLVVAVLLMPHWYWLFGPEGFLTELRESIRLKTENQSGNGIFVIGPLFSLLLNLIGMIAPLVVVISWAFVQRKVRFERLKPDWFAKLAIAQIMVLVLFFVVMDVQKIEERWLLPLVLPFMVLLVRSVGFKSIRKWSTYGFVLFLTVIGLQILRTPAEKVLGIRSSVHFGFEPLYDVLQKDYGEKKWMLPNVTYAGNIRLLDPQREVFAKDDFSLPKSKLVNFDGVEVVLEKELVKDKRVLDSIPDFGKERNTIFIVAFEGDKDSPSIK
ncbi:ArnT family glycosyltransferase [Maribacter polysiphoniae]|uniref:Dolichyl-phosphate-mannose-protein mannosyltransferase n=2 Tax=Maribacter polysiphoniae TaxID=429344 RepID=A0A316E5I7_9FLAO|nr:glycosyltransferase family 39 protein [Maribacter polysiphoniae]PWK23963.1 dolichyl-phosphate-mannose-protein mannosyltransferase [Maribacter polysiphoniae]